MIFSMHKYTKKNLTIQAIKELLSILHFQNRSFSCCFNTIYRMLPTEFFAVSCFVFKTLLIEENASLT
jgi:hypothetical protein